jgi:anti-sigma regulatory factor (Ser/Thr protein kinase)
MEVTGATLVTVAEPSQVSAARRSGASIAGALDFDEVAAGKVALAVTEAGTNLLKHAGGGDVVLRWRGDRAPAWVELLALDRGPGMGNVARCLEDGFSTTGSAGTGLGALKRLAAVFDVYSRPGFGTALVARLTASMAGAPTAPALEVEGIAVPKPGEEVCGDAFAEEPHAGGATLIVVDGLGHGGPAAEAARAAVAAFRGARGGRPAQRLEAVHQALRATRGAAVAIADVDVAAGVVRFAGLGNIAGRIHADEGGQNLVSQPGTAGHLARKIDEYTYPFPVGAVLVMHSDGLTAHYDLGRYPGLIQRHPALIAGVLLRDAGRGRDDAVVVVARARP